MKTIFKRWFRFLSLRTSMILLILLTISISLIASALFVQNYVENRENQVIKDRISSVARIVAEDERVIDAVSQRELEGQVQSYTNEIITDTGVEFIVVLDMELTRYSHPESSVIGETFSNVNDASKSLDGDEHYSEHVGILGDGLRFFTPVLNEEGEQVGVVCVGYTKETIAVQTREAQQKLLLGVVIGLLIGLSGSILLANKIKQTLLGLEPEQIATRLKERKIITDAVVEGIIAIDGHRKVLLINENAKTILTKADLTHTIVIDGHLNEEVYAVLFSEAFEKKSAISNQSIVLNHIELVINISPMMINNEFSGAVATFRDQSEVQNLLRELSGTEQYVDSLRAQSHHFMNQLHVILGLIELKKYEEVKDFVSILNQSYHQQVGYITEKIKSPVLAGFLLGKANEAQEQNVLFSIDKSSYFPNIEVNRLTHHLIVAIGVLLDNAFEAVQDSDHKEVTLFLHYNKEEQILMIQVRDTGIGMKEENKSKIFNRGFSTKGNRRGYGLDAVQTIIQSYNGMIEVESEEMKGTNVLIELEVELEEADV